MAISDYLNKLVQLKNDLITTLRSKGIEVSDDEKLNTLVPKVEEVVGETDIEWADELTSGTIEFASTTSTNTTYCNSLYHYIKKIKLPDGLTLGQRAFQTSSNLTEVIIGNRVTSIPNYAFLSCKKLERVIIGDDVTTIAGSESYSSTNRNGAFIYCENLKSVVLGSKVELLGNACFYHCYNLSDIYYKGTEEQWNAITKVTSWNYGMGSNVEGGTVIHYNYVPE